MRITFKKVLILVIVLTSNTFIHCSGQKPDGDRPNIIFILTDDLGFGDLGVFFQNQRKDANDREEPWMFTPHLDDLARQGARLPHHYCAAPVCAPSRASILLGVSQGHANIRDNQFDKALEDNHTMASVLRQAGYSTAAIGKWGLQGDDKWDKNGSEWPAHPLNRGFDYFLGYIRHRDGHEHYPKEGLYRESKEVWENRTDIADKLDKCYTADLWTAAAKKWILQHTQSGNKTPFFMYLAYDTPHAVLELPTQPYPEGGGIKGGLQWLNEPGHMINTASGKVDSWIHPDYANGTYHTDTDSSNMEAPWPETYKRYATSVRRIDSGVGDIVHLLKDLKIFSNTLIVFTSDNGPSLESYLPENYVKNDANFFDSYGPFDGVKRDCWEGGVRMPTLATWPARIPANKVIRHPSASYDWLPTFASAAGVPAPARCDGVSLLPSLTGKGIQRAGLVYVEYFNNGFTPELEEFHPDHRGRKRNQMQLIRIGDYSGVRYNIQSHEDDFEIYNVVKDPGQESNLADSKGMDSLQKVMHDRVLQVRRPNPSAPRPYDQALVPAVSERKTEEGVTWKIYSGSFPWIPGVYDLTPAKTGAAERPEATLLRKFKRAGVVVFGGYLRIPHAGTYNFYSTAPASALLRIHEATVIDATFGRGGNEGKVLLEAGLHPFTFFCGFDEKKTPLANLEWAGEGIPRQQIPSRIFCHD